MRENTSRNGRWPGAMGGVLCAALLGACGGDDAAGAADAGDAGPGGAAGGGTGGSGGSGGPVGGTGGTGGTGGSGGPVGGCAASGALPAVTGHAYYAVGDEVFRIEATAGAAPENVSAVLSAVAPGGRDRFVSASGNGAWIVMSSEKAGCGGECLARVPGDLSAVEPVLAGGAEVYVEGGSAIDDTGDRIVFSAKGGPHEVDLWLTERSGGAWGAPALLTDASTYTFNNMPAMNREGTHVVFDCGQNPYPEDGANDACEVARDGTGFRRVVGPDTLPDARFDKVQNPHPGPDGLLFEASWPVDGDSPELIWRLPTCGGEPAPIGRAFPNAVSPCALADGRFVFLWLGRPGNAAGVHELTLADRDGALVTVLTPDVDVADIGLGCSD